MRESRHLHGGLSDAEIASECAHCIVSLVAALERFEVADNASKRRARHAAHIRTIERAFAGQRFRRDLCWAHLQRLSRQGAPSSG